MSYAYEYTEGLKQFGMIHLVMKFTDSDNILPEMNINIEVTTLFTSGNKCNNKDNITHDIIPENIDI
jgi:hypothetical protein